MIDLGGPQIRSWKVSSPVGFTQTSAPAAFTCRRKAHDVLVASGESDMETVVAQGAEQLAAAFAAPLVSHEIPPGKARPGFSGRGSGGATKAVAIATRRVAIRGLSPLSHDCFWDLHSIFTGRNGVLSCRADYDSTGMDGGERD